MSIVTCNINLITEQDDFDRLKYKYDRFSDYLAAIVNKIQDNHRHYSIKLFGFTQLPDEYGDTQTKCTLQLNVDGELGELELKKALETVINEIRGFEYVFDCQYDNIDLIDYKMPVEKTRKVVKKQSNGNVVSEITEKNGTGRKIFILKE